jgi:putative ABC transport system permease protein
MSKMANFAQDLRHALRLLYRSPGFTAVAVLALALGIGAATSIFSVVDAALLRPLPFRDARRLMVLWTRNPAKTPLRMFVSPAEFLEWRAQARSFESMAAVQPARMNLSGGTNGPGEPEEIDVERVSWNFLHVLGVSTAAGRSFSAEEDRPGQSGVVILSHSLWMRRFGGGPATGQSVRLRDRSYVVAGVAPAGFSIVNPKVEAWIPLALNPGDTRGGTVRNLMVFGRLAPGVTPQQAATEMELIAARLERERPSTNAGWKPWIFDIREEISGGVRRALLVLFAAVTLLLLIACANVANLLLARSAGRQKEIALRTALGGSRLRIFLQLLAESVVLALAGGVAGVALSTLGIRLVTQLAPSSLPRLSAVSVDLRLLAFSLLCSLLTGIVFGLAPALQASRADLNEVLKEGGRGGTGGVRRRFLRDALVVAEIAIAVVVLIGAGLLTRSFQRLRSADPGFPGSRMLTMRIPLAGGRNAAEPRRIAFFGEVLQRLPAVGGVRGAAAVSALPLTGLGIGSTFTVEGRPVPPLEDRPLCLIRSVTPGYFGALGIPLLAGRDFNAFDTSDAARVALVNTTMARRFFPDRSAIGAHLSLDSPAVKLEIVGIAGDVKQDKLDRPDWPTVYFPYPQAPAATMVLMVRTEGDPLASAPAVVREIRAIDPDQPVADIRSIEQVLSDSVATPRFNAVLLAVFAGVAFVLAAVGIYGVTAYGGAERTREFGIRLALGAAPADIFGMVLLNGASLAGIGIAIGLAASFALTRTMASMLYPIAPADLTTFASVTLLLGAVALSACYLPSRHATAVEPVQALRHE